MSRGNMPSSKASPRFVHSHRRTAEPLQGAASDSVLHKPVQTCLGQWKDKKTSQPSERSSRIYVSGVDVHPTYSIEPIPARSISTLRNRLLMREAFYLSTSRSLMATSEFDSSENRFPRSRKVMLAAWPGRPWGRS